MLINFELHINFIKNIINQPDSIKHTIYYTFFQQIIHSSKQSKIQNQSINQSNLQFYFTKQNSMDLSLLNISQNLDTSKHSLNNSGSKQKFSFPKTQRFASNGRRIMCDSIYQIPTTRSIRTTSFGYGNKTIGLKIDKNKPEPATYTIGSQFQQHKKGISFGEGRQKLQLGGPMRESILRKFVPGPGNYQSAYSTLNVPPISLKSRIQDKSLDHLKKVPGPGAYNHQEIGSSKYYASSKYHYTGGTKITPGKNIQPINRSMTVGPGSYQYKSEMLNADGKYPLSRYQNSKTGPFSKARRQSLVNKNQLSTPGPGNYSVFSSFG